VRKNVPELWTAGIIIPVEARDPQCFLSPGQWIVDSGQWIYSLSTIHLFFYPLTAAISLACDDPSSLI
jgi:hypothetical protein